MQLRCCLPSDDGAYTGATMTSSSSPSAMNERFGIPGVAAVVSGQGGLPKLELTTPAAAGEVYLYGAQVTSWRPRGMEDALFVSKQAHWEAGKAIRGGIPVCFPWFRNKAGDPQAPSHGFARTTEWELQAVETQADGVNILLALQSDEQTLRQWPFPFQVQYRIQLGAALELELLVRNTGEQSFQFEEALHTYYRVGDARHASVEGLDGSTFFNNTENNRESFQQGPVRFTWQTDNAYLPATGDAAVLDPVLGRRLSLRKQGSGSIVVWNPWQDGAASLADLGDDEWQEMLCVEASNIRAAAVMLAPGEQHSMVARIEATSLGS